MAAGQPASVAGWQRWLGRPAGWGRTGGEEEEEGDGEEEQGERVVTSHASVEKVAERGAHRGAALLATALRSAESPESEHKARRCRPAAT